MKICIIPARKGSERLPKKNYLRINGLSILEIAIIKAKNSNCFDSIFINTDDPQLRKVANAHEVDFYLRDQDLASSEATSDQVVLDFFEKFNPKELYWLNTASPLLGISDIRDFIEKVNFQKHISAVTFNNIWVHSFFADHPINFEWGGGFAKTQDLEPIQALNYSVMSWSRDMKPFLAQGQLFDENVQLIESSKFSNFLLKTKQDFDLIHQLFKSVDPLKSD